MPRGRPREFDADKAVEAALKVFWRKGFEGASLPELTRAMRINRPSMYAAFGNKEALFRRALERYAHGPAAYLWQALNEPTARRVVERLLRSAADAMTDPRNPRGCLAVQGALACGEAAESVRKELISCRAAGEAALRRRLHRAKSQRDLPAGSKPADLARYITTLMNGMSVQAAGGATRDELRRVVDVALRSWPSPPVF